MRYLDLPFTNYEDKKKEFPTCFSGMFLKSITEFLSKLSFTSGRIKSTQPCFKFPLACIALGRIKSTQTCFKFPLSVLHFSQSQNSFEENECDHKLNANVKWISKSTK